MDHLASMMLSKPDFKDETGYFRDRNIDTVFHALNEGLNNIRKRLGEERYQALQAMSDQMRALFEANPDEDSDEVRAGRALILDMRDLIVKK
jgi:tRNA 2-selenouridine synthase SelU